MDPHTTQKESRPCVECHQDPRALGLGQGNLTRDDNGWRLTPSLSGSPAQLDLAHPLDAFVDTQGRPLVHTSRKGLRPFNRAEIDRILYVGLCLQCHKDFHDPVMKNWKTGQAPPPCGPGRVVIGP
jgi:hypothetical protein